MDWIVLKEIEMFRSAPLARKFVIAEKVESNEGLVAPPVSTLTT